MALQPSIKTKVDELFLLWLSEPETQELLRTNLNQILRGEPITKPASQLTSGGRTTAGINRQPKSPRVRSMTPGSAPPYLPANGISPRSPRPKNLNKSRTLSASIGVSKLIVILEVILVDLLTYFICETPMLQFH